MYMRIIAPLVLYDGGRCFLRSQFIQTKIVQHRSILDLHLERKAITIIAFIICTSTTTIARRITITTAITARATITSPTA